MPPDIPDPYGGFELDLHRHLGFAPTPIGKMDRDLADLIFHQIGHVRHLNQEYIPVGPDPVQRVYIPG